MLQVNLEEAKGRLLELINAVLKGEMAIKISLGRLQLAQPFEVFIPHQLSPNRVGLLGITISHTAKVAALPFHHRDPFDRLLVARAQVEQMPLVSSDAAFDAYGITRLW